MMLLTLRATCPFNTLRGRWLSTRPVAARHVPQRVYFYHVDAHGQLFLSDTHPKNFVTCFKDVTFRNFFFTRVRSNDTGEHLEWPYVSPCGRELNYLTCADRPIVFHDFTPDRTELVWAGDLRTPFDPSLVAVARSTGQLYYPNPLPAFKSELALIRPSVTTSLMSLLDVDEETGRQTLTWNGRRHLLPDV